MYMFRENFSLSYIQGHDGGRMYVGTTCIIYHYNMYNNIVAHFRTSHSPPHTYVTTCVRCCSIGFWSVYEENRQPVMRKRVQTKRGKNSTTTCRHTRYEFFLIRYEPDGLRSFAVSAEN